LGITGRRRANGTSRATPQPGDRVIFPLKSLHSIGTKASHKPVVAVAGNRYFASVGFSTVDSRSVSSHLRSYEVGLLSIKITYAFAVFQHEWSAFPARPAVTTSLPPYYDLLVFNGQTGPVLYMSFSRTARNFLQ
jgi:hypothetical protein